MPIIFQSMIVRDDLRRNPTALYLFGDNEARTGYGGQAKETRGEPNAVGIRTKRAPSMKPESFWCEGDGVGKHAPDYFIAMIENDFSPVRSELSRGKIVIIPSGGLGTGLAALERGAPIAFAYLTRCIEWPLVGRFQVPDRVEVAALWARQQERTRPRGR